ncbi:MAG: hypothetical protein AAF125_27755, partial [Chloroflexota bacterium]
MSLKTSGITHPDNHTAAVTLYPTKHFDFVLSVKFVQDSGALNHLDQIAEDHTRIERPHRLGDSVYWLALASAADGAVKLTVRAPDDAPPPDEAAMQAAIEHANNRFFMDVDMAAVEKALEGDSYGEEILARFFPARPANYPSACEALIKSVV